MNLSFIRFVGIGAGRAGTTSFYAALVRSPEVVPAIRKEIRFFDKNYRRRLSWYRRCFPITESQVSNGYVSGEFSPDYLFNKRVPMRMAKVLPDTTKLIVLLRDPVQAVWSLYCMLRVKGTFRDCGFTEAVELNKLQIVSRYEYATLLSRWFSHFNRERFLIIKSEKFFEEPAHIMNEVATSLGLQHSRMPVIRQNSGARGNRPVPAAMRVFLESHFESHNTALNDLVGVTWEYG